MFVTQRNELAEAWGCKTVYLLNDSEKRTHTLQNEHGETLVVVTYDEMLKADDVDGLYRPKAPDA